MICTFDSDFVLRHATDGVYVNGGLGMLSSEIHAHNLGEGNLGEPGDTLKVLPLNFFLVCGF